MFRRNILVLASAAGVSCATYYSFQSKTLRLDSSAPKPKSQSGASSSSVAPQKNIQHWQPPTRQEILQKLQNGEEYDLLVIGGGATGTGVALDAAARGLKVALVERDDFASGTSSKSTKLVHGGVRYLEKAVWNLDMEQYKLVHEALSERHTLLKVAPYLATPLPIMCPIYKWWQLPYYYAGVKAYDLVAGSRNLESSYFLTKTRALKEFPMLKSENLKGAVVYYDGQQNDSRMNIVLALTAIFYGADVANHVEVTKLLRKKREHKRDGDSEEVLCGASVVDTLTGKTWEIKAKGVINATGPFCDSIRKMDDPSCQEILSPSSGVHIVLPHYYAPDHMGLIDPATSDGRVIFFLPWEGNTVAGTTDAPTKVSYDPMPSESEIQFILNEVARYLSPDIKVRRGDVLSAWSGIRPLVRNPNSSNTAALVRNHLVFVSDKGLLTVGGGKWTTYRKMAEEAVDKAIEVFDLNPSQPCSTEDILLIGTHGYNPNSYIKIIQHYGMETEVAQHLCHNYGDRAGSVAALAVQTGERWPLMGKRLAYPYHFIEAEVRYACRREYACTVVDVIGRRTRLAFLSAKAAKHSLPRIIEIMAEELKWDSARKKKELQNANEYLKTMGLDVNTSRAYFKPDEVEYLKNEFKALDYDGDGVISSKDLKQLFGKQYFEENDDLLTALLSEVETKTKGIVDFDEFLEILIETSDIRKPTKFAQMVANLHQPSPERSGGGV
ncbi:hypothetical protein MP638_003800 [Amoeboaphelidium occidentale]|nr:hypothetical protein MP638_003800 [Amoeboaphelidium occidentale]